MEIDLAGVRGVFFPWTRSQKPLDFTFQAAGFLPGTLFGHGVVEVGPAVWGRVLSPLAGEVDPGLVTNSILLC